MVSKLQGRISLLLLDLGLQAHATKPDFSVGVEDLNAGLHDCMAICNLPSVGLVFIIKGKDLQIFN